MKNLTRLLLFIPFAALVSCSPKADTMMSYDEMIGVIRKVNDSWQASHPEHENAFWHRAAYHTGNMAAFEATGEQRYIDYSTAWAEANLWMGARSQNPAEWKYSYGESDEYVLFGDWQTCFQVYADLYKAVPDEARIARAREVMEYQMSTPNNDYWWWADGLYMVMPVMTRLYVITGDQTYLDKLYEYFSFARELMYDEESHLFFRDAKYVYPQHTTANGSKDFWARGNGWVFAAIPRVLDDLPVTDPHRDEYIAVYRDLASAIAASQQEGGYWTRSMLDPEQAPGMETSGTAFFTYGFMWGINNGLLDDSYLTTAVSAWNYLINDALQEDGSVGYVQPIGEKAIPRQVVDRNSVADFGVGAFLLAATEMAKWRLESGESPRNSISK